MSEILAATYRAAPLIGRGQNKVARPIAAAVSAVTVALRASDKKAYDHETNRKHRAARKAIDPEGYLEQRARYQREWRARNPGSGRKKQVAKNCLLCGTPGYPFCARACESRAIRIASHIQGGAAVPRGRSCATCMHPARDLLEKALRTSTAVHASQVAAATGHPVTRRALGRHRRGHM